MAVINIGPDRLSPYTGFFDELPYSGPKPSIDFVLTAPSGDKLHGIKGERLELHKGRDGYWVTLFQRIDQVVYQGGKPNRISPELATKVNIPETYGVGSFFVNFWCLGSGTDTLKATATVREREATTETAMNLLELARSRYQEMVRNESARKDKK